MAANTNDQVLVIVPDPQAGSVIERVLSALGVQGVVCKDGDAVRETLKTMTPALLICSESVPGTNGTNLSTELLNSLHAIPQILLADEPSSEIYKTAIRAGYSDCVARPLRTEDVRSAIQGYAWNEAASRREDILMDARRLHNYAAAPSG
jgi:DNA-binding NtrC family response regulator